MESTTERLKAVMRQRNLKQIDVVNLAQPYCAKYNERLGVADISAYLKGKYQPAQKKLTLLALALNVSEGWLMGVDVPMERQQTQSENRAEDVSDGEKRLLSIYRSLNADGQEALIEQAEFLQSKEKYTNKPNASALPENPAI